MGDPLAALTPRRIKRYGWRKDHPDFRDLLFAAPASVATKLPAGVDLRKTPYMPAIYDQGDLGSCTGNGIAALHEFVQRKQVDDGHDFTPSRLFIYYNERVMEGTVSEDAGAEIRDGMKAISKLGVCPEAKWPYDIAKFAQRPPDECYVDAMQHQALVYRRIVGTNLHSIKSCLAAGYPITFGFSVYESFEGAEVEHTGVVPMPGNNEKVLGGHCTDIVGYDDDGKLTGYPQHIIGRNSWGPGWGDQGYFYMPYAFVLDPNISSDFWTLRKTE